MRSSPVHQMTTDAGGSTRRRLRRLFAAVALSGLTLLGCDEPAFIFGVNAVDGTPLEAFDKARGAGFRWLRVILWWPSIEPNAPNPATGEHAYNWDYADRIILGARERNLHLIIALHGVPLWAQKATPSVTCPGYDREELNGVTPNDTEAYRRFAFDMVTRYRDKVGVWEIWNEPDSNCSFQGTPEEFRERVLAPAYDGIRAASPQAVILGPSPGGTTSAFSEWDKWITYPKNNHRYLVRPINAITLHRYGHWADVMNSLITASNYHRCTEDGSWCVDDFWLTEFGFVEQGGMIWFIPGFTQNLDPGEDTILVMEYCRDQFPDCRKALYWSIDWDDPPRGGVNFNTTFALLEPQTLAPRAKFDQVKSFLLGQTFNPYSLRFSAAGPIAGHTCVSMNDPSQPPSHSWADNYVCHPHDIGLQWSTSGPISGKFCWALSEPSEAASWNDNYLCAAQNLRLEWSYAGAQPGKFCAAFKEPSDPDTWSDNYACFPLV